MFRYLLSFSLLTACLSTNSAATPPQADQTTPTKLMKATFAGGCFWCMETAFEGMRGVHSVVSGYMDGQIENPTYEQVSSGRSGHTEVVQVQYDPTRVSYALLLEVFWLNVDPFAKDAQFCDRGSQYRSGIFFHDTAQKKQALMSEKSAKKRALGNRPFQVDIKSATTFYPAEAYHQDFYKKKPLHYKRYRYGCGRDKRLKEIWGASIQGPQLQSERDAEKRTSESH